MMKPAARTARTRGLPRIPIGPLQDLSIRHFRAMQSPVLAVSGRYMALLNVLIATLIAEPLSKAITVIDIETKFDATAVLQTKPHATAPSGNGKEDNQGQHGTTSGGSSMGVPLAATQQVPSVPRVTVADLSHIHVYRPGRLSRPQLDELVASAEEHMIYGKHGSRSREWWGTVIIGAGSETSSGPGPAPPAAEKSLRSGKEGGAGGREHVAAVTAGWKGWLRVDRAEVHGFDVGISVEEALREREKRQAVVDGQRRWVATSVWGGFVLTED